MVLEYATFVVNVERSISPVRRLLYYFNFPTTLDSVFRFKKNRHVGFQLLYSSPLWLGAERSEEHMVCPLLSEINQRTQF